MTVLDLPPEYPDARGGRRDWWIGVYWDLTAMDWMTACSDRPVDDGVCFAGRPPTAYPREVLALAYPGVTLGRPVTTGVVAGRYGIGYFLGTTNPRFST